jgi:hypothetical protein
MSPRASTVPEEHRLDPVLFDNLPVLAAHGDDGLLDADSPLATVADCRTLGLLLVMATT